MYRCPAGFRTSDAESTAVTQCKGTVSLNKNGGSGLLPAVGSGWTYASNSYRTTPSSIVMYYNAVNTFINAAYNSETSKGLTQDNYTFTGGWGTGTTCVTQNRSNIQVTQSTFYACKVYTNHTITLNQNGGTGGTQYLYAQFDNNTTPFRHQKIYFDTARTTEMTVEGSTGAIAITKPSKTGYTFTGYRFVNDNGTGNCTYELGNTSRIDQITGATTTTNVPTSCNTITANGYLTTNGLGIASDQLSKQSSAGTTCYAQWTQNPQVHAITLDKMVVLVV